jgi:hypothetical protein
VGEGLETLTTVVLEMPRIRAWSILKEKEKRTLPACQSDWIVQYLYLCCLALEDVRREYLVDTTTWLGRKKFPLPQLLTAVTG